MTALTEAALDTLRTGLDWLYSTEQTDDGSIVSHLGISAPVVDERRYRFIPSGFHRAPVVVVNVFHPRYTGPLGNQTLVNPLEPGELDRLRAQIEQWGHEVHSTWNGEGETGSVGLAMPAHPSLLAALQRQREGCPEHRPQILCGWDDCPWYRTHTAKLQIPTGWF
jgi:hypothetical protein